MPHVISCFTAACPNSDGVGDGIEGTSEWTSFVGDSERSGTSTINSDRDVPRQQVSSYMECLRSQR